MNPNRIYGPLYEAPANTGLVRINLGPLSAFRIWPIGINQNTSKTFETKPKRHILTKIIYASSSDFFFLFSIFPQHSLEAVSGSHQLETSTDLIPCCLLPQVKEIQQLKEKLKKAGEVG